MHSFLEGGVVAAVAGAAAEAAEAVFRPLLAFYLQDHLRGRSLVRVRLETRDALGTRGAGVRPNQSISQSINQLVRVVYTPLPGGLRLITSQK